MEPVPVSGNLRDMIPLFRKPAFVLCLLGGSLLSLPSVADTMPMRDYHLLDIGMSQAEVEYRVGPPDRESVFHGGYHGGTTKIIWYYIPDGPNGWITEIIFDARGRIKDTRRYKP